MLREFIASLRLAFALVCVGASLILGAQWLGFIPNTEAIRADARRALCESVAINSSAHVRRGQWIDLKTILRTQVERNDELLSIGLRSDLGTLRLDTGHHDQMCPGDVENDPRISIVSVPITLNRRPWGNVEFCFRKPENSSFIPISQYSVYRLVAFFILAGLFSYTLFVARIMGVFSKTQVVPDRVKQALDTLAEGLLVLDEEGRIVLANRAFCDTVGMQLEDLASKTASELAWVKPDADPNSNIIYPWTAAISDSVLQSEQMLHYKTRDGRTRIFSVNAAPLGGEEEKRGALATFRDVTHVEEHREELEKMLGLLRSHRDEIERKNGELEILATQDALTGCLNRRAFFERFDRLWKEAHTENRPLSCIMIDNDHFKSVNDTYGHHIGDEVLRRVSKLIRDMHDEHGLVCRYGGEEFCVVFPGLTLRQAINEAEKTRAAICEIIFDEPKELKLTASLGVSELRFDPADPQELINQADTCLYVAKREGRNRVIAYNKNMENDVAAEAEVEKRSKPAQLNISYQAVTALMSALSYRDAKTAEHSRRVADLCARAAATTLDPAQIYVLEIAAMLHDIGKVGVPDHILLKPGKLTAQEWKVMDRHDKIGIEIVAGAFECPELTNIIELYHTLDHDTSAELATSVDPHTLWCAKLLTIADSYDSMVSDSHYRRGCTHHEAIDELRRCAGTQFDGPLVEHFTHSIDDRSPTHASGAFALGKQTAIQIGMDVERLAEALENKDLPTLQKHLDCLKETAAMRGIDSICTAARPIESAVEGENLDWGHVVRDMNELLDACRAAQADFLRDALELENKLNFEAIQ